MSITIPEFERTHILVVGDLILDRYWHGSTGRISPEAPVPVVHITDMKERPGGAGNVALNLKSLGCDVSLFSFVGNDREGQTLQRQLQSAGVRCFFVCRDDYPTISKLRVLGRNQQLIRLDFEQSAELLRSHSLLDLLNAHIDGADAMILSDYAKGSLHHARAYIDLANKVGIPVFVDPKSNDFSLYRGATVITPNLKEFEAVVGHCPTPADLVNKGEQLLRDHDLRALLVTQGEHGMTLLHEEIPPLHLPTRAREVYDVTGAGDTVISVLAAATAAGESLASAATMANAAAGIVIRKLGAATVSVPELRRALQRSHDSGFGVLSEEALMVAVADARAHHETVVMTNGCFDILHAGHIQYLEAARSLGQRLIVAVNDDDSVRRLKGSSRPINPLAERMAVLGALRSVDWVVAFSEDTPERLIQRVSPDILVKGGDYRTDEIAGAGHVYAHGGQVKILPFKPGCSTSRVVARIKEEGNLEPV